jgi:2-oxo-4-hydroxy-4-carboxy-5-ureidoimidazoline decarboxylase
MNDRLTRWNRLSSAEAESEILPCCGARAWARQMAERRPIPDRTTLLCASDEIWRGLGQRDWIEAFESHPRIGESEAQQKDDPRSAAWSRQEQSRVGGDSVEAALAERNREYERRFGRIFIVCAMGKTGAEILEILERRLGNDPATEMLEAADEQRHITQLRLERWMEE